MKGNEKMRRPWQRGSWGDEDGSDWTDVGAGCTQGSQGLGSLPLPLE